MIKIKLFYLFSFMCVFFGYAHDADKAFFNISIKDDKTLIEAELPWSIRNVLIAYDSNYLRSKSKEETRAIFLKYAKENLKLFNIEGRLLKLLSVSVIDLNEATHTHTIKYLITYDGSLNEGRVENNLMLEYYKNQENYHWFTNYLGEKKEIITNKENPMFFLVLKKSNNKMYYFLGAIFIVLSTMGIVFLKKRKNNKRI